MPLEVHWVEVEEWSSLRRESAEGKASGSGIGR